MTELANAIRKRFEEEWNASRLRDAEAALTKAISGGDEYEINAARKRVDRVMNNTEHVLTLIEYTGRDSGGDSVDRVGLGRSKHVYTSQRQRLGT